MTKKKNKDKKHIVNNSEEKEVENKLNSKESKLHKESVLDLENISDLTIEEIKARAEEQEKTNKSNESVLDAYIRSHRSEIEKSKKIHKEDLVLPVNRPEQVSLDSSTEKDDVDKEQAFDKVETVEDSSQGDEVKTTDEPTKTLASNGILDFAKKKSDLNEDNEKTDSAEDDKKKKKFVFTKSWAYALLALLALFAGGGIAITQVNKQAAAEREEQAVKAASMKRKEDAFERTLGTYYTNDNRTILKNDMAKHLDDLKPALDKVKDSKNYDDYKGQVDSLKKQFDSLEMVNSKFDKPIIVDGKIDKSAKPKEKVDFIVSKSGLADLDKLIDEAVAIGKKEQAQAEKKASEEKKAEEKKKAEEAQAAKQAEAERKAQEEANKNNQNTNPSTNSSNNNANNNSNGVQNNAGQEQGAQDALSRVPIDQAAVNDVNNPAWSWNEGVLENVVSTLQSRGNIEGNQYYVKPVNIVNGNGYYNLYRTDGTYLVSINCKTGYFVGNQPGRADSLDF